jgi:hypothetical protein
MFNLVMNEIIKEIHRKKGYRMGNEEISIICHADNAMVIAEIRITYRDMKPVSY